MRLTPLNVVLAKAPEPGIVKSRLCPPLLPEQAAELAAAALLDTLDTVGPGAVVALTGRLDAGARPVELAAALRRCTVIGQRGTTLGLRIAAAHADATRAQCRPTLQIGMDTPQAGPALLAEAARALDGADAVLGPATDGGWWLLGLRRPADAALVAAVPTSLDDTAERTLAALRAGGLRVTLIAELTDVDTAADAVAVASAAPWTRFAAAVRALPVLAGAARG